jgi:hypothetical protein
METGGTEEDNMISFSQSVCHRAQLRTTTRGSKTTTHKIKLLLTTAQKTKGIDRAGIVN